MASSFLLSIIIDDWRRERQHVIKCAGDISLEKDQICWMNNRIRIQTYLEKLNSSVHSNEMKGPD